MCIYPLVDRPAWHAIDLGSTHKTRVNKSILLAQRPCRLYVGHVLKLGMSTRLLILTVVYLYILVLSEQEFNLQGPSEDVEEESELPKKKSRKAEKPQDAGWGIDARYDEDEDEGGCSKTAFAVMQDTDMLLDASIEAALRDAAELEKREQYYRADPKKALRAYCEREGLDDELQFEYTEKGVGFRRSWVCRLEVPFSCSLFRKQ